VRGKEGKFSGKLSVAVEICGGRQRTRRCEKVNSDATKNGLLSSAGSHAPPSFKAHTDGRIKWQGHYHCTNGIVARA
jgi:hypothetical protein